MNTENLYIRMSFLDAQKYQENEWFKDEVIIDVNSGDYLIPYDRIEN